MEGTIIITSFCQECIVLSVLNFNVFFADWPDYTSSEEDSDSEVETIVGGQETESDNVGETTPLENNNSDQQHHKHHHHEHHQHHHPSQDQRNVEKSKTVERSDGTATKIMNLLSEISHNTMTDRTVDHNFLPCKYCKGKVITV